MNINQELKTIEKEEARLAKVKKSLLAKKQEEEALEAKLDAMVKESGFSTPKALVEALIEKYGIRLSGKRGPKPGGAARKRTRTKVTKELRDAIKKDVKGGMSMNAASKAHNISYVVVSKIMKGAYDKMK